MELSSAELNHLIHRIRDELDSKALIPQERLMNIIKEHSGNWDSIVHDVDEDIKMVLAYKKKMNL
jgi:hypothetical protein